MSFWDKAVVEGIRRGYYSAVYFNRTKYILEQEHDDSVVTMQVFQRKVNEKRLPKWGGCIRQASD